MILLKPQIKLNISYIYLILLLIYGTQNKINGRLTKRLRGIWTVHFFEKEDNKHHAPTCVFSPQTAAVVMAAQQLCKSLCLAENFHLGRVWAPQECKFSKEQLHLTVLPGYFSLNNCKAQARSYSVHPLCCEQSPSGHGDLGKEEKRTWLNFYQSTHRHMWTWFWIPWSWRLLRLAFHARVI